MFTKNSTDHFSKTFILDQEASKQDYATVTSCQKSEKFYLSIFHKLEKT